MEKRFGWCFIGAGGIAHRVLADLPRTKGAYVASVYSRSLENANIFAAKCGAPAFDDLSAALSAPGVRAVYVASPHHMHKAHTLAALAAGLPVLCEKPLALTAADAQEMVQAAHAKGLFLMEGMWMRFNPALDKALAWAQEGRIGEVRTLQAAFASRAQELPPRLADPALGGGSLLDVGIYPVAMARFAFGRQPARVQALATRGATGVDAQCAVTFQYENGATARLFSATEVDAPHEALLCGNRGAIRVPVFWRAGVAELRSPDGDELFDAKRQGEGFQYEFDAAMADIEAGRAENALVPHSHTLAVMETLDAIRAEIGYAFPGGIPAGPLTPG